MWKVHMGKAGRFRCLSADQEEQTDERVLEGLPVLIVDDDEFICRNTCECLAELG